MAKDAVVIVVVCTYYFFLASPTTFVCIAIPFRFYLGLRWAALGLAALPLLTLCRKNSKFVIQSRYISYDSAKEHAGGGGRRGAVSNSSACQTIRSEILAWKPFFADSVGAACVKTRKKSSIHCQ